MREVLYYGHTTLHPLGLTALIVLGALLVGVPRRYAVLPVLLMACFVSPAQRIVVASLDFNLLRVMVMFGAIRVLFWGEARGFRVQALDVIMLLWAASAMAAYTMFYGTATAMIFRAGTLFDAIGMYFLFRCLVRNWSDVDMVVRGMIMISIPVAAAFAIEWMTGRNPFAMLGGVPEVTEIRGDRLRCQGAFAHPILAGCFWASLFPVFVVYRRQAGRYGWAAVGAVTSISLVIMSASSTPAMGLIFAVIGLALFPFRRLMGLVQVGLGVMVVVLHFAMNGPVWGILARLNVLSSSTGWHRFNLIDQAIDRIGEWWLFGTASTAHWGWGLWDVTNHYILEGVRGGLITMLLFILAIVVAFKNVGRIVRMSEASPAQTKMAWAMGVMLFVHAMNFIAVSYFGQIVVVWYLTLAMIASLTPLRQTASARQTQQIPEAPVAGVLRSTG